MANIQDIISLLSLDAKYSSSPFGGQHRSILIQKDYSNTGDFVFNNFLQHFGRKEPNTSILLLTLSHDWSNYSASAAKCGFNLRRCQNGGNIEVLDVMSKLMTDAKNGVDDLNPCDYIIVAVTKFIEKHTPDYRDEKETTKAMKPIIVMIDDVSILLSLSAKPSDVYRLFTLIDRLIRKRSCEIQATSMSYLVVQTMFTNITPAKSDFHLDSDLNYLVRNMENQCDLVLIVKPLDTGYSLKVDGTIKIVDNRLPITSTQVQSKPLTSTYLFPEDNRDIGLNKAFFFKLGDRRVRLSSSALIL